MTLKGSTVDKCLDVLIMLGFTPDYSGGSSKIKYSFTLSDRVSIYISANFEASASRQLWDADVYLINVNSKPPVSTHIALDHQTYCALDQHTLITWTAQLNCDEHSRVGRWRLGFIT